MRQHLIDPEVCIRCNTCEETCPVKAISHDSRNYVVDVNICKLCYNCISPCPTGAIDNWRHVGSEHAYTLAEQLLWDVLPVQEAIAVHDAGEAGQEAAELPEEVISVARQNIAAPPPWSAAHPYIALHTLDKPALGTIGGNFRLTADNASSAIHHIVIDFGNTSFPILEGQTIGILPPGLDANGKPHHMRLYSVASPRDGERPNYNNLSLTVKRVEADHAGNPAHGVASNYLCDLQKGDTLQVVGPYGTSFLMPNHPGSNLLMICTGTGAAPMRAMTERRRRRAGRKEGGELMLFFGARSPAELPYFGPLTRLPKDFIDVNLAFSRVPEQPRQYVQDLLRSRADDVLRLLNDENTCVYLCGLKGMETGINEALADICRSHGTSWPTLQSKLLQEGRYHVETY